VAREDQDDQQVDELGDVQRLLAVGARVDQCGQQIVLWRGAALFDPRLQPTRRRSG
jgi:hypothetical protein